ncbi:MAG: methyltransferase domain-containing protein [Acidobacteriota bacterium]
MNDERRRLLAENARRRALADDRYQPWNRGERFMLDDRRRRAAEMLERAGAFPRPTTRCLEVGFGDGTWLVDLLSFRVEETSLYGAEIDVTRAVSAHRRLPSARLAVTGGSGLPYRDGAFPLVLASTVFTSILDPAMQEALAADMARVLTPGGALLYYDFAVDNPRNPHVRAVKRSRVRKLFPGLGGEIRSATLAPPLSRRVAPWSIALAELLGHIPFLRTHLLAVLIKPAA